MYFAVGFSVWLVYNFKKYTFDYMWLFLILLPPPIILCSYVSTSLF